MKARLLDPQTTLSSMPDSASAHVAQLDAGQEVTITGSGVYDKQQWVEASLPDGRQGYLPAATRIQRLREMRLQVSVEAHVEPSDVSAVLERYEAGAAALVLGTTTQGHQSWIGIRDSSGKEGFVPDGTPMEDANRPTQVDVSMARAKRDMIVGGLWCGGGAAVTAVTYANASGGGTYVVTWGAIIFGGFQFLKGLGGYISAHD